MKRVVVTRPEREAQARAVAERESCATGGGGHIGGQVAELRHKARNVRNERDVIVGAVRLVDQDLASPAVPSP